MYFSIPDYFVFFGTIGISLGIGIYFAFRNRHKENAEHYFHGNRHMSTIPTALSLVVTFQSSMLIIGVPAEIYAYGFAYAYIIIGTFVGYLVAGIILVPVIRPLRLTSVYRYFVIRYHGNSVRYMMLCLGVGYYVLYMGLVTFGTCVALEVIMGLPHWGTILIYTCITSIYTSIGGISAVIWTDVFQIGVMLMGVVAVIIKSTLEVGGMAKLMDLGSSRLHLDEFSFDPTIRYQFWSAAVGMGTTFFVSSCQQPGVQRMNSSPTVSSARWVFFLSACLYGPITFLVCFEGVAIFAYYTQKGCDPLESGRIDGYDQIVPIAVVDLFAGLPGLSGLFLAALSSAALSTLSSGFNSLGAVTYDDAIREIFPNMSDINATRLSKVFVSFYGIIAMVVTFAISALPGSIMHVFYIIASSIEAPIIAVFLVSLLYRRTTKAGAIAGGISSMIVTMWLNLGNMLSSTKSTPTLPPASISSCPQNGSEFSANMTTVSYGHESFFGPTWNTTTYTTEAPEPEYSVIQLIHSISFMYYATIGAIIGILVSIIVSTFTDPPPDIDERCLFSFKRHVWQPLFGKEKEVEETYPATVSNREESEECEATGLMHEKSDV